MHEVFAFGTLFTRGSEQMGILSAHVPWPGLKNR